MDVSTLSHVAVLTTRKKNFRVESGIRGGKKTDLGYFRRGGLDLSFTGAVVIALLVTAGTRGRAGFGVWSCAGGCTSVSAVGVGVGVEMGVGVGWFSDAGGRAGLGVGSGVLLLSRPRESAFASKLLVVLVGRDAFFACGCWSPPDD
jgi:hypothetical protein